jgi:hypothetical protein
MRGTAPTRARCRRSFGRASKRIPIVSKEQTMTSSLKIATACLAAGVAFAGLAGCPRQEGPAERAGKQVGESVGKAGRQVDEAVDSAGKTIERAGEKIQDAAQDAKK